MHAASGARGLLHRPVALAETAPLAPSRYSPLARGKTGGAPAGCAAFLNARFSSRRDRGTGRRV